MNQTDSQKSHEEQSHSQDRMRWPFALPYLLAIWSCLSIVQNSALDIPPTEILALTIAKVLLAIGATHLFLFFVVRRSPARELVLLTFVSFFAFFGAIRYAFDGILSESLLLGTWSAMHIVGVIAILRMNSSSFTSKASFALGVGLAVMVGFQLINVSIPVANDYSKLESLVERVHDSSGNASQISSNKKDLPDIYYIIVDAYARGDILDQLYDFDNQPFTESLQSRGFYIADESRSNYNMTELSLASSLNMRHLPGLDLEDFNTRLPMRELIRKSSVVKTLKSSGYTTIAFETGKSETECTNFDQYIQYDKALCDYQDVLYHNSPLPSLVKVTGATRSASRRHGDRTLFALNSLPKVAQQRDQPAFVFCHMLSPHPPYLFDEQGKEVDLHGQYLLADMTAFTSCFDYDLTVYRDAYREQLAFMNQRLIQMVDEIQSSDREAIIIIQGDHGPRMGFGHRIREWQNVEWRFRESFSILNAICMPSDSSDKNSSRKPDSNFYPSMTPVNTFRLIFNELFDAELAMEDDTSFLEQNYKFSDLTDIARPLRTGQESATETQLSKAN